MALNMRFDRKISVKNIVTEAARKMENTCLNVRHRALPYLVSAW
jgi:hypothetical protein